MFRSGDQGAADRPEQNTPVNPPLVIVSERGRHSHEARRVVRAQAARASAAQSRATRARNREGRERETPLSPVSKRSSQGEQSSTNEQQSPTISSQASSSTFLSLNTLRDVASSAAIDFGQKPLIQWIVTLLNLSGTAVLEGTATLESASQVIDSAPVNSAGMFRRPQSPETWENPSNSESSGFQLPVALPRGFTALQQRVQISSPMLGLLSRNACIDFASPGAEHRLHRLLFDLIITSAGTALSSTPPSGHPIQGHLRVACTCLSISFLRESTPLGDAMSLEEYQNGLRAAWDETMLLDRRCLEDEKAAEVALWALFIISVTTGAAASFYRHHLQTLMSDLNLQYWEAVRNVLLTFIYPVYMLDVPCKDFYEEVCQSQHSSA